MKKYVLLPVLVIFITMFAMSVSAAQVAHWDFSETTGLVAHDSVGSYDGVVDNSEGNMAWTADSWLGDGALAMDNNGDVGTGGVVVINETGSTFKANSFTISAWIKPEYVRDRIVLAKTGSWSDIYTKGYELRTDGWGRKLMWYAGGSGGTFSDGIHLYGLEQNKWYNVIGMRDGNEVKLYVNGMLIGTKTITQPMNFAGTNPLTIGGLGGTNGKGWSFDGIIDDVRYYNHALSQTQIDQIYGGNVIIGHEPFTAEYLYAPELDTLSVQGYADLPASSAEVRFKDHTGDYSGTSACVPVIQNYPLGLNATPDYTAAFTDVAANWEKDTYNLEVAFFTDDSCANATGDVAYGGEFDALRILWIEDQLDQLNQTLQEYQNATNENLTAIWEEFNATWDAINANSDDIDWIEGQISDLWDALAAMNHGTINVYHEYNESADDNFLRVWGEAPMGATQATLEIFRLDQDPTSDTPVYTDTVNVVPPGAPPFLNTNSYWFNPFNGHEVDLWDFEPIKYNIIVRFNYGFGYVVGDVFDDLLLIWLEDHDSGFSLMDTQTFEVWNPQDSFTRKISWAFTAPESGWYWFELVNPTSDNGEDISKVFAGGTAYWINSHETKYFKNRNVLFPPEEGSYKVKLKAHKIFTSETIKSNAFRLIIDDLAHPWPEYNVSTVSVTPDEGNYAEGVYWTANPIVWITGLLGNNTEWMNDLRCEVWNYKEEAQAILAERWDFLSYVLFLALPQDDATYCTGDLNLEELDPLVEGSAPQYLIELCAHPISGQVECDRVTFGYDTTPPVIDEESLDPGTSGIVNGLWNFSADVTDDGVISRVWFTLTNKTDASQVCQLGDANNTVGDTWVVAYNTSNDNCTPDGYYNFTVYAIDYAGNEAELMIDPIIDNTPPVIQEVDVSGYVGSGVTIDATITDNLAGVLSADAGLVAYTCPEWEEESCDLNWCNEYQEEGDGEWVCDPIYVNETAWTVEEYCDQYWDDEDYDSYEECVDDYHHSEFCNWQPNTLLDCEYSNECWMIEGSTVEDCVDECEPEDETCVFECYADYCGYDWSEGDVQHATTCTQNCAADMDCEERAYADMDPIPVTLSLTDGTSWNGHWTGTVEGLDPGYHYEVRVNAMDGAGNNAEELTEGFYAMLGYVVTLDAPAQTTLQKFPVTGTIVASDGSEVDYGSVEVDPGDKVSTPLMGTFAETVGALPYGLHTVTATYTPQAECPDITYTDAADVIITQTPKTGGGGGGGGSYTPEKGGEGEQPKNVGDTEKFIEDTTPVETGAGDEGNGGEGEKKEEPKDEGGNDLVTGAVTGERGFFAANWPWLLVLLGLIVILLAISRIVKKH